MGEALSCMPSTTPANLNAAIAAFVFRATPAQAYTSMHWLIIQTLTQLHLSASIAGFDDFSSSQLPIGCLGQRCLAFSLFQTGQQRAI